MSRGEVRSKWQPFLLALLLGSQFLIMTLSARHRSRTDGSVETIFRSWSVAAFTPLQQFIGSGFSGVTSLWDDYVDLRGVRDRNAVLEEENGRLRSEIENARAAAAENERLRRQLDLKPLLKVQTVTADVVARDADAWFERVTINKGSLAGIRLNHPVVTPDGLVGRIVDVGPNAAQIQLITDEHAGAGGRLVESRAAGEVKGRGNGTCGFKSISSIQQIREQEVIVTSGLDRVYPAGILVGFVEAYTPGAGASPHDIVVRPAAQLDRLEEVMVLIVTPQDLATPEGVR
jgi:rod shape-determining protein MreC